MVIVLLVINIQVHIFSSMQHMCTICMDVPHKTSVSLHYVCKQLIDIFINYGDNNDIVNITCRNCHPSSEMEQDVFV
jgi:hypothetical protein